MQQFNNLAMFAELPLKCINVNYTNWYLNA